MKGKKQKNYFLIGVAILLGAFVVWNAAWAAFVHFKYKPFVDKIPKVSGVYLLNEDGMDYSVKKPGYLSFEGNLGIIDKGNNAIVIWPKLFGETKYEIMINTSKDKNIVKYFSIIIDKNGQPTKNQYKDNATKVWEENKEAIYRLVKSANEMWDL
jgi:hypothetical protein